MERQQLSCKPYQTGRGELLRRAEGQAVSPTVAVFDRATCQCTPESKRRADYDS
jgi:hypothetical protein